MIAEKPDAAQHIAQALAEKSLKKKTSSHGVDYYEFERGGEKHIAVAAVGHLFNLKQKEGKGWSYPIFNVDWAPSFSIRKKSEFSEKYFKTLEEVAKGGGKYIVCCDWDTEGSVIGWNILKFICGKKDAERMKFSTLTKQDLIKSYQERFKHMDWENVEAGETRHILDFLYGVNASRALTLSIKKASPRFALLSAGRVQGPVLSFLAEREKEIRAFKPVPFWQISAQVKIGGQEILAEHETDKFWKKDEAEKAFKGSDVKNAVVEGVEKKEHKQSPPVPFNITSLQTEAYRLFGYSPQQTSSIAQDLYTKAFISYPRTSSEKLPLQIGYREILEALSKVKKYQKLAEKLLALPQLRPTEGKRDDPAHEAIHPTVEPPYDISKLRTYQRNIYDLVVRRYLALFGEPALRETMNIELKMGSEKFFITGRRTLKPGWIEFYGPLAKFEEVSLPEMKKGDKIDVKKVEMFDKETQPPARYSQAAVVKEMEKRNLGTRATRAGILQTLYDRYYITDKSVRVTDLGMKIVEVLKKYVPDFIDEGLTREFEKDLERVLQKKATREKVIDEAKKALTKICREFKANEDKIGKDLGKAVVKADEDRNTIGKCVKCGGDLKLLFSIFTKKHFVGCNSYNRCAKCNFTKKACKCKCSICGGEKGKCKDQWKEKTWYPTCQTGYPLPHMATIQRLDKTCPKCGTPMIRVIRKGKRPFNMCLATDCETKADWGKKKGIGSKNIKGDRPSADKKKGAKGKKIKGNTPSANIIGSKNINKVKEIVKKRNEEAKKS